MTIATVIHEIQRAGRPITLSVVAGIVDDLGGFRVVVERPDYVADHILSERKEEAFVIPWFWVHEPVSWERVPSVIKRAAAHTNDCLEKARRNTRVSDGLYE